MTAILFDTETHDRDEPEIIEAAWLEVDFGNPTTISATRTASATTMLTGRPACQRFKPSKPIKLGAMATHSIMDEDLVGCDPSAMFELPPCDFVVGHNVDFDVAAAGAMHNGPKRIDTCAMARDLWPDLDCYSQAALIYHLDRQNARERLKGAHGAAADILLCKTILDAEIALSGCDSWEALWRYSESARIPKRIGFGKHKGMLIGDLPESYKKWLLNATDPPIDDYLRIALGGQPRDLLLFCPK